MTSIYNFPSVYNQGIDVGNLVVAQNFSIKTMDEADATNHYTITGATNNGSVSQTAATVPISFILRRLGCHIIQGMGDSGFRLCFYTRTGVPVCRTDEFTISTLGENFFPVDEIWDGTNWIPGDEIQLNGGELYYMGVYCPQVSAAARFLGRDAGTTFGPKPWIVWTADNLGAGGLPAPMPSGYESSVRFLVIGAA